LEKCAFIAPQPNSPPAQAAAITLLVRLPLTPYIIARRSYSPSFVQTKYHYSGRRFDRPFLKEVSNPWGSAPQHRGVERRVHSPQPGLEPDSSVRFAVCGAPLVIEQCLGYNAGVPSPNVIKGKRRFRGFFGKGESSNPSSISEEAVSEPTTGAEDPPSRPERRFSDNDSACTAIGKFVGGYRGVFG
jgi:hypothetical protein